MADISNYRIIFLDPAAIPGNLAAAMQPCAALPGRRAAADIPGNRAATRLPPSYPTAALPLPKPGRRTIAMPGCRRYTRSPPPCRRRDHLIDSPGAEVMILPGGVKSIFQTWASQHISSAIRYGLLLLNHSFDIEENESKHVNHI